MRVEIADLRDDPGNSEWSGEDLLDDDWQSDDYESQDYTTTVQGFVSYDEDDRGNGQTLTNLIHIQIIQNQLMFYQVVFIG